MNTSIVIINGTCIYPSLSLIEITIRISHISEASTNFIFTTKPYHITVIWLGVILK